MPDFLIIQHPNPELKADRASPRQLQDLIPIWQKWFRIIDARNCSPTSTKQPSCEGILIGPETTGRDFDPDIIELIGGISFIQAEDYDEAIEIARNCPILKLGGTVELRMLSGTGCR